MKTSIRLITLLLIFNLTGCTLDDHEIPSLRFRITSRQTTGQGTYTYNYDAAGRMSKETFFPSRAITPYYYDFTSYDAENRLLEAVQNFEPPFPDLGHEVQRDSENKITRIRSYCTGGPTCTSGVWYYAYPSANTVEVEFWDNGSLFRGTTVYTFNALGQLAEVKSYDSADELTRTRVNTSFDNKRNMLSYYPDGFLTAPIGVNNVLTFQVIDHVSGTTIEGSTSYEYNADGWVTKQISGGTTFETFEYESY